MEVQLYLKGKEKGDQCRCKSTLPAEPFFYLLDFCVLQKDSRGMEYAGHVTNIIVSNSGLLTVRLIRQARLSLYQ